MAQMTLHRSGRPARWGAWSDLFDDFVRDMGMGLGPAGVPRHAQGWGVFPPVNLSENDDAFVLTAELPGLAPGDIDVSLEGKTVTLSGQRKTEVEAGDGTAVHRRERQTGHFRRAFELPRPFEVDKATAVHRNGVLELTLPKTPEAKPRQIEVQTS